MKITRESRRFLSKMYYKGKKLGYRGSRRGSGYYNYELYK